MKEEDQMGVAVLEIQMRHCFLHICSSMHKHNYHCTVSAMLLCRIFSTKLLDKFPSILLSILWEGDAVLYHNFILFMQLVSWSKHKFCSFIECHLSSAMAKSLFHFIGMAKMLS
ncbi:hypothetical protein ACSQ67_022008 [Phaseolus vulgaris]